jgi:ligand-binding sensor domain-containing protein/signal transduction histidine kinase
MARTATSLVGLLVFATVAAAERLPIRVYSVADGLPHSVINRIVRDSRGFLWFCTADGLSVFDGYRFSNFGVADGLPHSAVRDLLETREGEYWVATAGGVSRFDPRGAPKFTTVTSPIADQRGRSATALWQGRDATVWVGTFDGLMRLDAPTSERRLVRVEMTGEAAAPMPTVTTLLEDQHGTLWIGTDDGLYRRWRDGRFARYDTRDGLPSAFIHDLLEDRRGQLWVATRFGGFFTLATDASDQPPVVTRRYNSANGYVDWIFDLFERADGRLEVATNYGVYEFRADDGARDGPAEMYTKRHGFSYHEIETVAEDRDGNLWLGSTHGAMKIVRGGFLTFDDRDNVHAVNALFESPEGELHAFGYVLRSHPAGPRDPVGRPSDTVYDARIGRFDGQGFTWLLPEVPSVTWSDQDALLLARTGEWWIATNRQGLYVFPAVQNFAALQTRPPVAAYGPSKQRTGPTVYALYEEADGDIWISTTETIPPGLARWERRSGTIRDMAATPGLPPLTSMLARAFQEDRSGNIWIGFSSGTLARYASDRFTMFSADDGVPAGQINDLHLDREGRLWVGSASGGLIRVDDPAASRPVFVTYSTAHGLSSNAVTRITEDLQGRIYAGTGRGIDRLTPSTGRIRHFTTADGLAPGAIRAALRDKSGALWFGTLQGLSRLIPETDPPSLPPPIWIRGLHVAGEARTVSVLGEADLALPDLPPGGNQLQIDFGAVSFAPGETLRYQYKLTGARDEWSVPTDQQTLQLAGLAPGRYTFAVRALNADGVVSAAPAQVAFTILAPVWRRPWFLAVAALVATVLLYGVHRYRMLRILELERVRTRIATDLHDDIGANLTRIAILSEVARQPHDADERLDTPLSSIATIARESVASMNDIVWAISPERDTLREVVRRMRHHAEEVFESRDIELALDLPDAAEPVKLGVDVRRDLLLIFKEAVNNAARHSRCTRASIVLRDAGSRLMLEVSDNGNGFDAAADHEGHGLASMHRRARRLGASLEISTTPGAGTTIRLAMPIEVTHASRALHG